MLAGSDALTTSQRSGRRGVYLVILITAVAVFVADHVTKWLVTERIPLEEAIDAVGHRASEDESEHHLAVPRCAEAVTREEDVHHDDDRDDEI